MSSPLFSLPGLVSTYFFGNLIYKEFQYRRELSGGMANLPAGNNRSNESVKKVLDDIRRRVESTKRKTTTHQVFSSNERVHYVTKMIRKYKTDPEIRRLAVAVLSRKCGGKWCVNEKDWANEVRALFKFTRDHGRYTRDVDGVDTYQSPLVSVTQRAMDCDCYVILLGSMLQSVGYPMKSRIIKLQDEPTFGHIYLMVGLPPTKPTGWVPLDPSVDEPAGFQAPASMVQEFRDFSV